MLRALTHVVAALVAFALLAALWIFWPHPERALAGTALDSQNFAQIERGRYLTIVGDCASCHDDPETKASFAGGRSIETPFGNVVAANITPDRDTGIGGWSDDEFVNSIRRGRSPHNKLLYPAMPYPHYANMTKEDALAIRAFLNTVQPVRHEVASDQLPFPLNMRIAMAAWNALFFQRDAFRPDSSQSAEWNRGAYLVQGLAHCGACHTPKDIFGADERSADLQGGEVQGWFAPNITGDPSKGLGRWSAEDIVDYLKSGHNAAADATGPMAEEIGFSSTRMTDSDLKAIATYLKSLSDRNGASPAPIAASDTRMTAGASIFAAQCSACHGSDGKGVPGLFPGLALSLPPHAADPSSLIRVALEGARTVSTAGEPTGPGMPSFAWKLGDREIAAVLTYVRNSWGLAAPAVTTDEVAAARRSLAERAEH
jgi:mono/diheme cytochrome c family protein